jgi:hypothetical protein
MGTPARALASSRVFVEIQLSEVRQWRENMRNEIAYSAAAHMRPAKSAVLMVFLGSLGDQSNFMSSFRLLYTRPNKIIDVTAQSHQR